MIISQVREVRTAFKAFVAAQTTLSDDLVKWASDNENLAIKEAFSQILELNLLWSDVQKEFSGK